MITVTSVSMSRAEKIPGGKSGGGSEETDTDGRSGGCEVFVVFEVIVVVAVTVVSVDVVLVLIMMMVMTIVVVVVPR